MNKKRSDSPKIPNEWSLIQHPYLTHKSILNLGDGEKSLKFNHKGVLLIQGSFQKEDKQLNLTFLDNIDLNQFKGSFFLDPSKESPLYHVEKRDSSKTYLHTRRTQKKHHNGQT